MPVWWNWQTCWIQNLQRLLLPRRRKPLNYQGFWQLNMVTVFNVPPWCPSDFSDRTSGVRLKNINAGVSELADETDSKSVIRKGVWVRVPPPAPWWSDKKDVTPFFSVFMRVCGLFGAESEKRFYRGCPNKESADRPTKRSFRLIFQAGNSAFLRFTLFFPVVGYVKVSDSYIDRLTTTPKRVDFKPSRYMGVVRPFLEPLRLAGRGGF